MLNDQIDYKVICSFERAVAGYLYNYLINNLLINIKYVNKIKLINSLFSVIVIKSITRMK